MLAAISPAAHVDSTNVGDLAHRPLDTHQQDAELRREIVGQVAGFGVMRTRLQEHDD